MATSIKAILLVGLVWVLKVGLKIGYRTVKPAVYQAPFISFLWDRNVTASLVFMLVVIILVSTHKQWMPRLAKALA